MSTLLRCLPKATAAPLYLQLGVNWTCRARNPEQAERVAFTVAEPPSAEVALRVFLELSHNYRRAGPKSNAKTSSYFNNAHSTANSHALTRNLALGTPDVTACRLPLSGRQPDPQVVPSKRKLWDCTPPPPQTRSCPQIRRDGKHRHQFGVFMGSSGMQPFTSALFGSS